METEVDEQQAVKANTVRVLSPEEEDRVVVLSNVAEAQARAIEQGRARAVAAQSRPTDPKLGAPASGQDPGGYNNFWTDPGATLGRISGDPHDK